MNKSDSKNNVDSKKTSAGNDTYSESKKSGEFLGETKIQKVDHKEYTISAKGSEYATGIKLPKLTKINKKILNYYEKKISKK